VVMARILRVARWSLPGLTPGFVMVIVMGGRAWVTPGVVWAYARSLPENRHIDIDATSRHRALIRLTPIPPAVLLFRRLGAGHYQYADRDRLAAKRPGVTTGCSRSFRE
jgi:hypothetical protein